MLNILIIYVSRRHPLRASQRDHLWSFRKYAEGCRCYYVNVAFISVPRVLRFVHFDIIIFDWSFLGARMSREWFKQCSQRLSVLKRFDGVKIALPQDEFVSMDLLCDFVNEFGVGYIFSVAPESEWPKIYSTVDRKKVKFLRVLTGYLDDELVNKVNTLAKLNTKRTVDIGYRTVSTAVWGRFNLIKKELADLFQSVAPSRGLVIDIAVGSDKFLIGDDWLRFLLRCRCTLGVEGGSSLLDWDGSLATKINQYLKENPDANFDDLEGSCDLKGRDGEINVVAISPRHLEACLSKTCQILVEGDYNGILCPGIHYIPLKRDYSNLNEVLDAIEDDDLCKSIAEKAYQDIVASGRFGYANFVQFVLDSTLADRSCKVNKSIRYKILEKGLFLLSRLIDTANLVFVVVYSKARNLRDWFRRMRYYS